MKEVFLGKGSTVTIRQRLLQGDVPSLYQVLKNTVEIRLLKFSTQIKIEEVSD